MKTTTNPTNGASYSPRRRKYAPTEEERFRNEAAVAAARGDYSTALIFADWLEETFGGARDAEAEAIRLKAQAATPMSRWPSVESLDLVTPHQREQLGRALVRPVCCLTGGPGTGKTTCLAAVVRALSKATTFRGPVSIAAPTGKAAVRVTEALRESGIHSARAQTVHQLLEVTRTRREVYAGFDWGFARNPDNPFSENSFIIVDECSMLDTSLAYHLFRACVPGVHLLLVGDVGQLPPVGHGSPLRDFLDAGLPHGELTEIHRNAGLIVRACAAIREGKSFATADRFDPDSGDNLRHVEADTPAEQLEYLTGLLSRFRDSGTFDPVWDLQVIVAVNDKGELARSKVNALLQDLLNPGDGRPATPDAPFRVADKIICLRNQWIAGAETSSRSDFYLANGDIGQVLEVDPAVVVARFDNPRRTVAIGMRRKRDDGTTTTNPDFALAYAVTGHKMQGSEVPCAIVLIDESAGAHLVCSRQWWYTSLSRARRLCVTIGKRATMHKQARRPAAEKRKTRLVELLTGRATA